MNLKRPVLRGVRVGQKIVVFCCFCDQCHIHSYSENDAAQGAVHRDAHCRPEANSPFKETGYYVATLESLGTDGALLVPTAQRAARQRQRRGAGGPNPPWRRSAC
jgi:hypothetical protein